MPSLRDLRVDLKGFTPAEEQFLREHASGEFVVLGNGSRPEKPSREREIRAAFIRHFMLGGCPALPCHETGVRVLGAWIPDALDLQGCDVPRDLLLEQSHFVERPNLLGAHLRGLYLDGSFCPGLTADGLRTTGSVHLANKFAAEGEVRLLNAKIGGTLACVDGSFRNGKGDALSADGIETGGDVFLSGGFTAQGEVRLLNAKIGGTLACVDGSFRNGKGDALSADGIETGGGVFLRGGFEAQGAVRLLGARIGGDLDCVGGSFRNEKGLALNADNVTVSGVFFLRGGAVVEGVLALTRARLGVIVDDRACWPEKPGWLRLDGCTYDAILGGPVDAETRLEWLGLQDPGRVGRDLWPQPYEQLAKVFRAMGHAEDARKVLVEKERRQRADFRERQEKRRTEARQTLDVNRTLSWRARAPLPDGLKEYVERRHSTVAGERHARELAHAHDRPDADPKAQEARDSVGAYIRRGAALDRRNQLRAILWGSYWASALSFVWDRLLRHGIGYGYRPQRSLLIALILTAFGWLWFHQAWEAGDMTPNSAVVLNSPGWAQARHENPDRPAHVWSDKSGAGRDYESFHALAYAFDVVIPLIDLGQEAAWAPSTTRGWWGWHGWWLRWVLKILGWVITALGAAAITGIIRRE